ncbi:hypothetical protein H4R24_004304 [Coemansia sp. RSA 988]|nr:hypothetical protein H4R24_004304 [Coemansia sp. RSA 988]
MRTLARIALGRATTFTPGLTASSKCLGRRNETNSAPAFPERRNRPGASISVKEHLYGIASVKAALMQGRRPIYGLYVQKEFGGDVDRTRVSDLLNCAQQQDVPTLRLQKSMMDKLARERHHQGVILKTGVIVTPKMHSLSPVVNGRYSVNLRDMTSVEHHSRNKYPLFLCLDEVQDPVNMGSVLRSSMFFGADGVIFSKGSCSPTPAVSRISAGCMECMNIYKVAMMDKMLKVCRSNGWLVICATVSNSSETKCVSIYDVPKLEAPALVIIGGEGNGISPNIEAISDLNIHIPASVELPSYIDSLNAGVAAGIIMSSLPHVRSQS